MKKGNQLGMVKPLMVLFLFGCLTLLNGCTTFGTFSNLKQKQSTSEEVRKLLGEPEEIRTEEKNDVWKYTFVKPVRAEKSNQRKVMETEIVFQDGVITDYKITVVTKTIPDADKQKQFAPGRQPMPDPMQLKKNGPGHRTKGRRFMQRFDINRDGKVTRNEYSGRPELFNRIDSNNDNVIQAFELEKLPE